MSICSDETVDGIASRIREQPMTVAQLARHMGLSPRTVHCGIFVMRERGWCVESEPVPMVWIAGAKPHRRPKRYWLAQLAEGAA